MRTELEKDDIKAIAQTVVEMLKPILSGKGNGHTEDVIFDVSGLAEYLKVDVSWVYKQVSLKTIPFFKNGKYTRFKKSSIDRWIDSQTQNPLPPINASRIRPKKLI